MNCARLKPLFFLLLIVLWPGAPPASANLFDDGQAFIQVFDEGEINWTDGLARATGSGAAAKDVSNPAVKKLQTVRSAKIAATRKLLEVLKKIRVDESTTTDEYLISSEFVRSSLHRIVREAKVVEKKFLDDDRVEVTLEISIKGAFIRTMVPDTGNLSLPLEGRPAYTGLIIDATGLGVRPALVPRIMDERGKEIYGPSYAQRDSFLSTGLAAYMGDISLARESSRIMENPLVVSGIRTSGPGKSNIIISREDAEKLKGASGNLNFLQECRVIIVTDQPL